jgi:hypothetical protein
MHLQWVGRKWSEQERQCSCGLQFLMTEMDTQFIDINHVQPNLHFTFVTDADNIINYLHLSIQRLYNNLQFTLYQKPTLTDTITLYTSCDPTQCKYTTVHSFIHSFIHSLYIHIVTYATLDLSNCILQKYGICPKSPKL